MLVKILAAFLVITAVFLYLTRVHPLGPITLIEPSVSLQSLTASALLSASTTLPSFDDSGIAFVDSTGVPYLLYEKSSQHPAVNELLLDNTNTCAVSAGGYSCPVPPSSEDGAASITPGDALEVRGSLEAQGLRAQSVTPLHAAPAGMAEVQIISGQSASAEGITIAPKDPLMGLNCTLGVGCTGENQLRIPITLSTPGTRVTELLSGSIYDAGKALIVLVSAMQQDGAWTYVFAVAQK